MDHIRQKKKMTPRTKHLLRKIAWSVLKQELNRRAVGELWCRREMIDRVQLELNTVNFPSKGASVRNTVRGYLTQLCTVGYIRRVKMGVYMRVACIEGRLTSYRLRREYDDPSTWITYFDPRRLI